MSLPLGSTRRQFLKTSLAAAGAATLRPYPAIAQQPAKFRRYNVTSTAGQRALVSYAKAIRVMLSRPPDHPHNWFRNAFVHLMDCPHGNWWFYVWHRGYIGYFEQTIRNLSGDSSFTIPYWDWTQSAPPGQLARIPDSMFNDVLTPIASEFAPYTKDIATFTSFIQPALKKYWAGLNHDQLVQLNNRGYTSFDKMWNDVTGFNATLPPPHLDPTNQAFAQTPYARYLTRTNPNLTDTVTYNVSPFMVRAGLLPTDFYDPINQISFNSSKTPSHNTPPSGSAVFSTLEGFPHNSVHNCIGGYPPIPKGPWGNMTNNLSPVDPIFFLHHSNMDRLWDVWTRKQQALKLPFLPDKDNFPTYADEPFLFYIKPDGTPVGASKAGDYISTTRFQYDYEPGFGEELVKPPKTGFKAKHAIAPAPGKLKGNTATVILPENEVATHFADDSTESLFALVTVPRPTTASPSREFDVLVGAPSDVNHVSPGSPYFAGTLAFFGGTMHMPGMSADATFIVPLPKRREAFAARAAGAAAGSSAVTIKVVPAGGGASVLKAVTVRAL
jgi:tyrosinase